MVAANPAYMFEELGARLAGPVPRRGPRSPEHGDSDPLLDGDWDRHGLARSVLAFLAELGIDRGAFVGASVGGITSITVGALAPAVVESLDLIDVAPRMEAAGRNGSSSSSPKPIPSPLSRRRRGRSRSISRCART